MVIGALAVLLAGCGMFLIVTSGEGRRRRGKPRRRLRQGVSARQWMDQAGLSQVSMVELISASAVIAGTGAVVTYVAFEALLPSLVAGISLLFLPAGVYRSRRLRQLEDAHQSWPRLLEELRLLTGSVGRSIPQALFEVGRRAPSEMRVAFDGAEREWLLTTDFARTAALLKEALADPTADAVLETLVVANEVGGGGLDRRLAELIEDRVIETQGRKDAISKQSGVRFARSFVLLVPLGMALAGMSIGSGRSAYASTDGQIAVAIGLLSVLGCWLWSGRIMRLPSTPRVFAAARALPETSTASTVIGDRR